jgi:hypothetical protein
MFSRFPGDKREAIMNAWNDSFCENDEVLYYLLYSLAFGEVFADVIQNPSFQDFVTLLLFHYC